MPRSMKLGRLVELAEIRAVTALEDEAVRVWASHRDARTDRQVAFFTEEVVRSFIESGALKGEQGAYRLVRSPG